MAKRRNPRYEARFNVGLEAGPARRIRQASDRYGVAEAVIIRQAIDAGLDRAIDAVRKQVAARADRAADGGAGDSG